MEVTMRVRNTKYLVGAILMLLGGAVGLYELYGSRDLSKDYYGPPFLLLGLLWLYGAFRRPSSTTE
jgi:hypothetical protein